MRHIMSTHTPNPFHRLAPEEIPFCRRAVGDVIRSFRWAQGFADVWLNYRIMAHVQYFFGPGRISPLPMWDARAYGDTRIARLLRLAARDLASAVGNLERYVMLEPEYVWLRVGWWSATVSELRGDGLDVSLFWWLNSAQHKLRANPVTYDVHVWHRTREHITRVNADLGKLHEALDTRAAACAPAGGDQKAAAPVPGETVAGFNDTSTQRAAATAPADTAAAGTKVSLNVLELIGELWHLRYTDGGEKGHFKDRAGSVLRVLTRLLAEPYRRFHALEFDPPDRAALPGVEQLEPGTPLQSGGGRDATSDNKSMRQYEAELRRLAQKIKEAVDAHDTKTAAKLRKEFKALVKHVKGEKGARKAGHRKRCGPMSPAERADHRIRVGLDRLTSVFKIRGMPNLAAHLKKHIDHASGEWWYVPPPGTSAWQVQIP
jgi:hypothetical protein